MEDESTKQARLRNKFMEMEKAQKEKVDRTVGIALLDVITKAKRRVALKNLN